MNKIIGLTGGIGSGKSKVAKQFIEYGIPCYTSDQRAKNLMNSDPNIQKAILNEFGSKSYMNGALNRKLITDLVFKNKEKLSRLNEIVHPAVAKDFNLWVSSQNSSYVIKETAILFENGAAEFCDHVVLVTAPKDIRIQRVVDRDKCSEKDVIERMSNQWSDEKKVDHADFVIKNIKWKDTLQQIDVIYQKIKRG